MRLIVAFIFLTGCTTINVTSDGDVTIDAHKAVTTNADASL